MDRRPTHLVPPHGPAARAALLLGAWIVVLVGGSSHLASADRPRASSISLASADVRPVAANGIPTRLAAPAPIPLPPVVPELLMPELLHIAPKRLVEMEVTAYCACKKCCGPNAQGITASGKTVDYNAGKFIAADTTVLPFGTRVSIPGYHNGEPVEVIDRGGAIKGHKLDVYFPTHEEALQWGRQMILVQVEE